MIQNMTGKQAILEILKLEGVEYIFGNPGTSEAPLINMLGDYPELKYILSLQESVAVGMAEAYARCNKKASFVNLHVDNGLANGISLILDAYNTGTPMVVTSANYDARKIAEGITDLADLVRPVTKWAVELTLPDQIPSVLRRAFKEANTHPKGPVYVGFTSNALEGTAVMDIAPSSSIRDQSRPDLSAIEEAADILLESENPVMIVGDRVSDDNAVDHAIELAELVGFSVYQSRGAEVAFPTQHEQFFGNLSLRLISHREVIKRYDTVLTIGMDTFEDLFHWGDRILTNNTKLIHIDSDQGKIGKSEPTSLGIVSNCNTAIEDLIRAISLRVSNAKMSAIKDRVLEVTKHVLAERNAFMEGVKPTWDNLPITPARMMSEIAHSLPKNAMVVDDSLSNRASLRRFIQAQNRGDIIGVRGQSIGGGIGATMGVQCANSEKKVFGIIGDGSAMMTIQGLWTAANENIPCVFIICNNGMYRILKTNYAIYQKDVLGETETAGPNLLHSDFGIPFDVASIANSMGVYGERIERPEQIKPAIDKAVSMNTPVLLDIIIDGSM